MRVTVNEEIHDFDEGATVAEALAHVGIHDCRGIAVELNGQFVERDAYPTTCLQDGSTLEVVRFVGGG